MLYFTCTMMSSVDLARHGIYHANELGIWACGTIPHGVFSSGEDRKNNWFC